jgi:hypothetical protein
MSPFHLGTYVGQKLEIWARNMGKDVKLLGTTCGCTGTMWEQFFKKPFGKA